MKYKDEKTGKSFAYWVFLSIKVFVFVIFSVTSFFGSHFVYGAAGVPKVINFQGRLMNSSGDLLGGPSGTDYCYKFSIYDATTGGSKIWPAGAPSTMTITTREGVFDAYIGDVSAGGDTLDLTFTDDQAYVNVEVATKVGGSCTTGGDEVFESMSPRPRIASSAFAINSSTVGGFTPAQSATNNQIPVLTSGELILSHATAAGVTASGSNPLTFQSGSTGDINFFSTSNKITSAGALTIAGLLTAPNVTISGMTTGSILFAGSGGAVTQDNANFFWNDSTNRLGIGTATPDQLLHSELADALTTTVSYPLRISHITSNTAGTGFGIGQEYELENASGTNRVAASQEFSWSDATNATEDTTYALQLMRAGTLTQALAVGSTGNITPVASAVFGGNSNRLASVYVDTIYGGGSSLDSFFFTPGGYNAGFNTQNRSAGTTSYSFTFQGLADIYTSGTAGNVRINRGYAPTSGTGVFSSLEISPTINQTGGANGITRGIYINPTLTAAADYRGLEITNNAHFAVYQSGASARNYFAGNIELNHLTANTLSASGGVLSIEGKALVNLTDGGTFLADISVPDEAYGVGWNGSVEVPTKNALYDKIEAVASGGANTALSNLASVAINTSLISDTTNTDDLGSSSILWKDLFVTNIELGHASDLTLSRAGTGILNVEGVRVITSSSIATGTILKNNGTTYVESTETYAAPGTPGNVMTSDGTNWTSAAPSAGAWNSITNPTSTQSLTFDDGELNAWTVNSNTETFHTITANSLTSGKVLSITSTSATSGNLINLVINGTAAGNSQTPLNIVTTGANASSDISTYGALINNAHSGTNSTNVGLQVGASGGSNNYGLIVNDGNTGIGDTTPASLFTVGSGDLFQINSTGQIGSQQAPVSDYLFALAGTTGNDNSRIIDITQANNADEDSSAIYVTATPALSTIAASRSIRGGYLSLTPSLTVADNKTANIYGSDVNISLSSLTHGPTPTGDSVSNVYGSRGYLSGSPVFADTDQSNFIRSNNYAQYGEINVTPVFSNGGIHELVYTAGYFKSNVVLSGGSDYVVTTIGGDFVASGDLGTTNTTQKYGNRITVSGTADTNYGLYVSSSGGTTNYGAIFASGNVGIGDTDPVSLFTVGSGDLFQVNSSGIIASAAGITSSGTITFSGLGGGGSQCVLTDNSGVLSAGSCGGGGASWNGITNPTADQTLTFDAGEETTWTIGATTATNFTMNADSLTSGTILSLASNGTGALTGQKGLNISLAGANGTGGQTTYGAYVSNTHTGSSSQNYGIYSTVSGTSGGGTYYAVGGDASGSTAGNYYGGRFTSTASSGTNYGIYVSASGGDTDYAAIFAAGNVGVGDITPNSLFTVGSGDLFQINSTGQIGSQQAPVSDYLFALAGTTGNDNSRIIDITQANNADESSSVLNIVATPTLGSIAASRSITGSSLSLTPSLTVPDTRTANIYGNDTAVSLSNVTLGNVTSDIVQANALGSRINITGTPVFNDTTGAETTYLYSYGTQSSVVLTPTLTNITNAQINAFGGSFEGTVTSGGHSGLTVSATGIYAQAIGNLTTTGNTSHYGANILSSGTADVNYGIYVSSFGATTNYAAIFATGNVGIGDVDPASLFTVGSGDLFQVNSSGDILTANTENLSITTGTTGILTLDSGTTGAVNLATGNNAKTISIGTGTAGNTFNIGTNNTVSDTINIGSALDNIAITSDSWSVTDAGALTVASCAGCGGSSTWNGITNPTADQTLTFDAGEETTWTIGATTATNFTMNADSLTSGTILSLASNGTGALTGQKGLNISLAGANGTGGQTTYGAYVSNTHSGTSVNVGLYLTATNGFTNLGLNVDSGQTLLGGTTLTTGTTSKLNIVATNSSNGVTTAVAGIHGDYTFNNGGASSYVQVGNRFVFTNAPTTNANTMAGEILRAVDNTTLANLVRVMEITANAGSNTAGTNTGIRTTGATFGIQALTNGSAGSQSVPAAIYGENTGDTQGDILRLYSTSMTSAAQMAHLYHSSSTWTGTGLLMDFATGSGTFSGNFVDFQKNNTTLFKVTNAGITSLGFSTNQTATSAVCSTLANATAPTADTLYELRDCGNTPVADYAEMYPTEEGVTYGEIVVMGEELVDTYDTTDGAIDWTKVKGQITKLVKSNVAYQKNIVGVVSDNYGDFSSTGYNIKEEHNPMPVALVGRVPVKIAPDSLLIQAGDYITTSNIAGQGMKAVKAGMVIGKALQDWDPSKESVMIYVEQGYWNGVSSAEFAGIDISTIATFDETSEAILAKLVAERGTIVSAVSINLSELVTDRVVAGLEIITPNLVAQTIKTTSLIVEGDGVYKGLTLYEGSVEFMSSVNFKNQVEFEMPPIFNKDTAGFALIKEGDKKVRITFENTYVATPVVTASIAFEGTDNIDSFTAESFFNEDIKYLVLEKDNTGFTILINKNAPRNIRFSWIALGVRDANTFESIVEGLSFVEENNSSNNTNTSSLEENIQNQNTEITILEVVTEEGIEEVGGVNTNEEVLTEATIEEVIGETVVETSEPTTAIEPDIVESI